MPLPNVYHSSLLNWANLYFLPNDVELGNWPHLLYLLIIGLLVHSNHPPLMIIRTCILSFDQFKRSKVLCKLI